MSVHSFDSEIAQFLGIESAVLLNNINYWIEKNKANETHFYDGSYWTYNSVKAFGELFPYMSKNVVRSALKTLEKYNIIKCGNYNKTQFDRTMWYSITEFGYAVLKNPFANLNTIHLPENENGFSENQTPIPYINTEDNHNDNPNINVPSEKETEKDEKQSPSNDISLFPKDGDKTEPPEEPIRLANLLYSLHKVKDSKYLVSDKRINAWARDIDLLHRADGRDFVEIEKVIRWAKASDFWAPNIMSGGKLRDQYSRLLLQMQSGKNNGSSQFSRRTTMCEIPEA